MGLLFVLILLTRIPGSLPWWTFIIPVVILGIVITIWKWKVSTFAMGFLCGFIIWFGANLYFDLTFNGAIMSRIGLLFTVPRIVVLLLSGVIGGVLTGLALFTGRSMVFRSENRLLS